MTAPGAGSPAASTRAADGTELACQAVLFDMDGTLIDSSASIERAWSAFARERRLPVEAVLAALPGRTAVDILTDFLPGPEAVAAGAERVRRMQREHAGDVRPLPGAFDLLAALPADRWAVVTAAYEEVARARLAAAGLPEPPVLIAAESVRSGKPDPEGYERGAQALGAPPRTCVVFEDADVGIRAGRAAGCRCVGVGEAVTDVETDARVPDLRGVTVTVTTTGLLLRVPAPRPFRRDGGDGGDGHHGNNGRRRTMTASHPTALVPARVHGGAAGRAAEAVRSAPAPVSSAAAVTGSGAVTGFDIGGTWLRFRSGGHTVRRPAPSRLNHPTLSVEDLTERLLDELTGPEVSAGRVVVSLGAAMDDLTGRVHGSGPLWGSGTPGRDLVAELAQRRPDISWHVYNDVTCAVTDLAAGRGAVLPGAPHVAYVTVSSGIALKTADLTTRTIAVDPDGFQGEIGHLPAALPAGLEPVVHTRLLELPCPCGGAGHVSSVAAGPALPRVARVLGMSGFDPARFPERVAGGDAEATLLLDVVVHPLAQAIRWLTAIDPLVALVVIGGGVAEGLGTAYQRALERHLDREAGYTAPSGRHATLAVPAHGEIDPIRGAALLADGFLRVVKP